MPETHGTKADGAPITDEMVEAMTDEAERGYDVEQILGRCASEVERFLLER